MCHFSSLEAFDWPFGFWLLVCKCIYFFTASKKGGFCKITHVHVDKASTVHQLIMTENSLSCLSDSSSVSNTWEVFCVLLLFTVSCGMSIFVSVTVKMNTSSGLLSLTAHNNSSAHCNSIKSPSADFSFFVVDTSLFLLCPGQPDSRYIRVETCMFMVKLPQYTSLEVMLEKLRYAIHYREDPLSGWEDLTTPLACA